MSVVTHQYCLYLKFSEISYNNIVLNFSRSNELKNFISKEKNFVHLVWFCFTMIYQTFRSPDLKADLEYS